MVCVCARVVFGSIVETERHIYSCYLLCQAEATNQRKLAHRGKIGRIHFSYCAPCFLVPWNFGAARSIYIYIYRQTTSTSVAALPCSPTNIDHVGGDVVHTIVVAIHIPGFVIYVWSCIRFADSMRVHCGEMLLVQNSGYEYISLMIIKKLIQREIMHGVFVVSLASLLFDWLYEGCHEPGWYA